MNEMYKRGLNDHHDLIDDKEKVNKLTFNCINHHTPAHDILMFPIMKPETLRDNILLNPETVLGEV